MGRVVLCALPPRVTIERASQEGIVDLPSLLLLLKTTSTLT